MKNVKRVLSILLSLMLVLGAVSVGGVSASAELSENAELLIDDNPAIYDGRIVLREGTGWSIAVNGNSVTLNLDNLDLTCGGNCIDARYLDLIITGSAKLTSTSRVIYIDKGNLTLNGDFTLRGQDEHGCALNIDDSLTVEGGSLSVINTGNDGAIILLSTMWVKGGSVYAKTESSSYRAISGSISLDNGEAFALGDEDAKEVLIKVPSTLAGKGTEDFPYMICDYTDLKLFASKVNGGETAACAKLMKDIDASASAETNDWTPIGYYNSGTDNNPFIGTFDGDGHVITGLTTPEGYGSFAGLFGYVGEGGTVQNVGLEDGSITGNNYVGGVVGNNFGTVENCYNKGAVSGADCVGGVVGLSDGTVTNCYNTGNVSGSDDVGGVVGFIRFERTVTNCYNTGNITATDDYANVGGIAGVISRNSTVTNCYSTGNITATGDSADVGGVAGFVITEGKTINCYYDKTICGEIGAIDGADSETAKGLTTAEMTGIDALSDSNMKFIFESGETNPWLTKADGAEADGGYYWYYPHLKGFAYDRTSAAEDWPAKVEITVALSDGNSCTYDGEKHGVYVTVGDTSVPEGAVVIYSERTNEGWKDLPSMPTDPGKYRMTIRDGEDTVTKYFTILEQATDYTVSYYKKTGDGWSSESVDPVDAGEYKPVVKFTADGHSDIEKAFKINPKSLSDASISIDNIPDVTYDGSPQIPPVTIKDGDTELVENADYSLSYSDNVNVSRDESGNVIAGAKVTVTGERNYTGDREISFTVNPASVILEGGSRSTDIYDGTEKTLTGFTSSVPGLTFEGVTASGSGIESGPHDVTFSGVTVNETTDTTGNYIVTGVFNGWLNINPVDTNVTVTIKGNSETANYDGSEHSAAGYTFETSNPLYKESDFIFSGTDVAERAEPGTTNMGLAENQFANISRNFTNVTFVIAEDGKLTVNPVIRFVNEDGTELQSGAVAYCETPEYTGEKPVKEENDGYDYVFAGWTPEITAATDNATYTATYTKTAIEYKAKFVDENGETVEEVPYTVETESIEEPAVPEKQGYAGEWEEYELAIGGITVKPVYANISSIEIEGYTDSSESGYREDRTFTVNAENLPEGAEIHWFVNGEDVGTGESYTVEDPTEDYNIYAAVVDADGNTLDETQVQAVKVRNGFMDKLKWFFSDFWNNIFKAVIDAIIKAC